MQELPTVPSSALLCVLSLKVIKNTRYKIQSLMLLLFQVHPETVSCSHHQKLQGDKRTSGKKDTMIKSLICGCLPCWAPRAFLSRVFNSVAHGNCAGRRLSPGWVQSASGH